ncbi:MAG: S-methyl-5'-thioadenosine phosphorylase [Peptococcaceae bacterium]|nr:S-methyl-5'-thioadenosine phosphorylase [Peptococcaceae bacterium]
MSFATAFIGGTGVYDPDILDDARLETVDTPYGEAVVNLGRFNGRNVVFLARHGAGHSVPPHRVNYRANMAALKKLGVQSVLATAAVGSLNPSMQPGDFVAVDQFIDLTKSRPQTYFEGGDEGVVHTDMTDPYCPRIRELLGRAGGSLKLVVHAGGTYVCTEGPRFETPAEVRMIQHVGGDLVGMTGVPEVVLARELDLCYSTVAMVTNFAAGISPTRLSHQEVLDVMAQNAGNIQRLAMQVIDWLGADRACPCRGDGTAPRL